MPNRLLPPSLGIIVLAGFSLAFIFMLLGPKPGFAGPLPPHTAAAGSRVALRPALDVSPPSFSGNPLLAPANGATETNSRPGFDWADATDDVGVVSYTLRLSGDNPFSGLGTQATTVEIATTASAYTPTQILPNGIYTWTVQAHDAAGNMSGFVAPFTFTVQASFQIFFPIIIPGSLCPTTSSAVFEIIPIDGNRTDRPDYLHGDLNLSLRGYAEINAAKNLVDYTGSIDPHAPQLAGIFNPHQFPGINIVYQVNNWNWGCGTHGCPGPPITNPEVTLMGLNTTLGQSIYIPERSPEIYGGGYKALVLYAEERRITLGYTRQDSVAPGYAVHLDNICVDPNLLALYRAQVGVDRLRIFKNGSYWLPALRNNQVLGTALNSRIDVAIRDKGSFMDPRSRKDWWAGF